MGQLERQVITNAYESILAQLPLDEVAGTVDTPRRAADALLELTSGYGVDIEKLCRSFESHGYDELIVVDATRFVSLCEHHVLPFVGIAHIAYLPNGKLLGLSKFPRIIDAFARRLQIQERLTMQIADAIETHATPLGVMVVLEAEHACCTHRGIKAVGTVMRTSVTRGALRTNQAAREEALALFDINGRKG